MLAVAIATFYRRVLFYLHLTLPGNDGDQLYLGVCLLMFLVEYWTVDGEEFFRTLSILFVLVSANDRGKRTRSPDCVCVSVDVRTFDQFPFPAFRICSTAKISPSISFYQSSLVFSFRRCLSDQNRPGRGCSMSFSCSNRPPKLAALHTVSQPSFIYINTQVQSLLKFGVSVISKQKQTVKNKQ